MAQAFFLAAAPPRSRALSQYFLGTCQLPSMAQVRANSSIPPPWDTTYPVGAAFPSRSPMGQRAPLPGNPASYAKRVATDSQFQDKVYETPAAGRKCGEPRQPQHNSLFQQSTALPHRVAVLFSKGTKLPLPHSSHGGGAFYILVKQ